MLYSFIEHASNGAGLRGARKCLIYVTGVEALNDFVAIHQGFWGPNQETCLHLYTATIVEIMANERMGTTQTPPFKVFSPRLICLQDGDGIPQCWIKWEQALILFDESLNCLQIGRVNGSNFRSE